MGAQFTRSIGEILRSTLQRLEETPDFRQDDPAVIELKKHIVRTMAELEIAKIVHSSEPSMHTDRPAEIEAPLAEVQSEAVTLGMSTSSTEPAPSSAVPEPVVSEPATEIADLPLLAENGTATAT